MKRGSFLFRVGAAFALLVWLLAGCGGGASSGTPGFALGLDSGELTIPQGGSAAVTLTVTPKNGFKGKVALSLEKQDGSAATGFTLSPTSVTVSGGAKTQTLTIAVDASVAAGTYRLKVVGASGKVSASADLTVTVRAAAQPSFTLGLDPTELTVTQGESGSTTLTVTPKDGFNGTVTLSLRKQDGSAAAGFTLSPTSVAVSGGAKTQTLTISVASSVEAQSYQLKVVGTNGSLVAEAPLTLTVAAPPPPPAGEAWGVISAQLYDVAYGEPGGSGVYVAVGVSGAIFTSDDGANWTFRSLGENETYYSLEAVTYGGGRFVAVGGYGTVFTSNDGSEWIPQNSGSSEVLRDVAYGDGVYVAVGSNGTILYSSDAADWHEATVPADVTGWLKGVAYGQGVFVAVGNGGVVLVSSDGANWHAPQTPPNPSDNFSGVVFGGGRFVAVGWGGTVATSDDGETWSVTEDALPYGADAITYGEPGGGSGVYVVTIWHGQVYTSADASSWSEAGSTAGRLNGVGYGAEGFVAVGGGIYASADGQAWSQTSWGTISTIYDVIYADGRFVAVGGAVLTSPDGLSWTEYPRPNNNVLYGVAYGGGKFVAVGGGGTTAYYDGTDWQLGDTVDGQLKDVAYGEKPDGTGLFVAVGWKHDSSSGTDQPKVYYSEDGSSWTPASQPPTGDLRLLGVTYGQKPDGSGLFVAVGWDGAVFTSADGDRWTEVGSGTSEWLEDVIYAGGRFVAVGSSGTAIASTDGEAWSPFGAGISGWLNGVGYGGGRYVAVGERGAIFTKDGEADWVRRDPTLPGVFNGVAYGQDRFVAVGGGGVILVSPAP